MIKICDNEGKKERMMTHKHGWLFYFVKMMRYLPLIGLIYSTQVFAIGNLLHCYGDSEVWNQNAQQIFNTTVERTKNRTFKEKTQLLAIASYDLGLSFLCKENIPEGVKYLEIASQKYHIQATYLLALFYETGSTFDMRHTTITNHELQKAIYYYNEAEQQIERADDYPYGIHEDMFFIEQREHTSAKVFVNLPRQVFNKFSRELNIYLRQERMLDRQLDISPVKTVRSLFAMRNYADKCLSRPFPATWLRGKVRIRQIQQTQCQAMGDFAIQAIPLEARRLQLADRCRHWSVASSCAEHDIVTGKLIKLFNIMENQVLSVSLY